MSTHHILFTAALSARLPLGALLLAHALLLLAGLGAPAFGAALAVQGMPLQTLPATLVELAGAIVLPVGLGGRVRTG